MKTIEGGITAPRGFVAASAFAGIKAGNKSKPDVALIYSTVPAVAAATFTTNKIKAAPVRVSATHLRTANIRAVIANSGNANACTGVIGIKNAKAMAAATARGLQLNERQVLVCSTGRIGVQLPIKKIELGIERLCRSLTPNASIDAARAIMTSDTFPKQYAVEFKLGRAKVRIGGIAKGAGMIDPNMATMLCFLTTDAAISKRNLQRALSVAVERSFNRITIDGDMSTNDTVIILANNQAENTPLVPNSPSFVIFQNALTQVACKLAQMIVEDGEGVSKFVEVKVKGAATVQDACRVAEAIANSSLVKCAWYGGDPNWGRIMDAIGYSGAKVREGRIAIFYDRVAAVKNGMAAEGSLAKLCAVAARKKFCVTVNLQIGHSAYEVFTTDLTPKYVDFNKGE